MSAIGDLLRTADAYGNAVGLEVSTVSWRVFGDTKKLNALRGGADIQVKRCENAMRWFAEHWPDDLDWPAQVARPSTEPVKGAA